LVNTSVTVPLFVIVPVALLKMPPAGTTFSDPVVPTVTAPLFVKVDRVPKVPFTSTVAPLALVNVEPATRPPASTVNVPALLTIGPVIVPAALTVPELVSPPFTVAPTALVNVPPMEFVILPFQVRLLVSAPALETAFPFQIPALVTPRGASAALLIRSPFQVPVALLLMVPVAWLMTSAL